MTEFAKRLLLFEDVKYKVFQCALMPTVTAEKVIGVRTPQLRKLAAELVKETDVADFMQSLPHQYYEEDNLHACFIEKIKDFDKCISELNRFLPFVDNWATCDMMNPKVLKKEPEKLLESIDLWLSSKHTYTVRYAIGLLMRHYLDEKFSLTYPFKVAEIKSEEYYINMMRAWYFATALSKQYDAILPFIEEKRLDEWTHNKTIQKAIESYRITDEQKSYLKTLKIKSK